MSKRLTKAEGLALIAAKPEPKPELPYIPFKIGQREFKLCLAYEPLVKAESKFSAQGYPANLLLSFVRLNYGTTLGLFACSLGHFHPEISFLQAMELLTPAYAPAAAAIFAEAIQKLMEPDPPVPDAAA